MVDKALMTKMVKLLEEVIEPGVFGYHEPMDPYFSNPFMPAGHSEAEALDVLAICEKMGYGRVMQLAEALWHKKNPGSGHTTAAAESVRKRVDAEIRAVLEEARRKS